MRPAPAIVPALLLAGAILSPAADPVPGTLPPRPPALPGPAFLPAARPDGTPPEPLPDDGDTTNSLAARADLWHAALSSGIVSTVDRVDRFFGDERLLDDNRATVVRAGVGVEWNEADGASLKTRLNARLSLPHLEQKVQLIADNFTEADDPTRGNPVGDSLRESHPDAGLRYVVKDEGPLRFSGDAGLRLGSESQVFGKLRARLIVPHDPWEMRLTQIGQWYSRDGFGTTSEMRWSRVLSHDWVFQTNTRLSWREDRDGITPGQSFTWHRAVGTSWGHRISVDAEWPEFPHTTEDVYVLSYGYRRLIHRDWLFIEIVPGVDFNQARDYEPNPRFALMFEVMLGELRER